MKLKGLACYMWVCCLPVGCVVLFRHCCYFSMPFYHLLVSLLGVKMTSVGGGKPRRQSWSPFHVKLGENTHLRTVTHCHTHTIPYTLSWGPTNHHGLLCLLGMWMCLMSLSLSLSPKPTMEEIKQWAQSFDKLMKNPAGRNKFREFLRTEYSEENMLFWLACEDLKKEINKSAIEEKTRLIYEDYISILSPKEVHTHTQVFHPSLRNIYRVVILWGALWGLQDELI